MPYAHTLRVGTLNCKGLKPHGGDVKQHLLVKVMQDHKIDLLLLHETHVNTKCTEVLKEHTFVYSTSIRDEQRKQAETNRTREVNKGKGRRDRLLLPNQLLIENITVLVLY